MAPRASRPVASAQSAAAPAGARQDGLACVLIGLAVLIAYLPALRGGFIWDDNGHVTRADLQSFAGLFRIWFEVGATQQYYPLLHSAFWLEHRLWGDAAVGYHLTNVFLHIAAACLLGRVLTRLAVPGAWLAAALFALHPVCVESVAWISEQKNTLSAVFYLLGALAYIGFDRDRRPAGYARASAWFLCALLTKTVTASLPAALLVVFWWRRGRIDPKRDVLPLLPWFALGAMSGLFTARFERELIGAQGADFALGIMERGLLAGRALWFYLGKLAWPVDLVFIYPRWTIDASVPWQWLFTLAALALLAGLIWRARRSRAPLAAALLFGGTLFPVLGFFNVYPFLFSYVADHFQYLASLGVFALAAAGLWQLVRQWPAAVRWTVLAGLPLMLGTLSWHQCGRYRDEKTLFQDTLARNPDCWLACQNLAVIYANEGRVEEAIPLLEKVLRLHPGYALAENSLGDDLARLGRMQEGIAHLERAIALEPRYHQAYNNLGSALMAMGQAAAGIPHFEKALALRPEFAEAERNLGMALAILGRTAEALPHFERAVKIRPDYADAELNLAIALMLTRGLPVAIPHFERAIALDPDSVEARETFGRALVQAGRLDEARGQYEAVVRLAPGRAGARMNLALVLRQLGRTQEATTHYLEAIRLDPSLAPNH
jgi:tetratricopeptide (TPR) repeat protein